MNQNISTNTETVEPITILTQLDDVGHRHVPAAFGACRHSQVVDVPWRQRQAGPHHVTSHLTTNKQCVCGANHRGNPAQAFQVNSHQWSSSSGLLFSPQPPPASVASWSEIGRRRARRMSSGQTERHENNQQRRCEALRELQGEKQQLQLVRTPERR